ncbi:MAG: dipeptide epimerase [Sulfurimonas sp.]
MKIKTITSEIKYIPLKTPFITALRRVENVEFVRVKIECDNGLFAFGEAPATMAITGEDLEIITNSIDSIKKSLISTTPKKALSLLHLSQIGSSAKAALDMAFVSLLAKEQRVELYEYLGAKERREIKTDITISLNTKDKMLQDAKEAYENGHDILKVKLGSDINHAIEVTKQLSLNLPKAKLLIDANQAWSLEESLLYVNAIKDISIELIEQPVKAKDLASLKSITQATNIPILADEAAFSLEDVKQIVETKSANMINIKLMKCGGITKAVEILEYARENHVKCMLGSMLEGPISIDVAMNLAMAYSDVIEYVDLDSPLLYKEV